MKRLFVTSIMMFGLVGCGTTIHTAMRA